MKLFGSFTRGKNGIAVRSPDLTRRGLIVGAAASLIAAPAIVRAASLMPVKAIVSQWQTMEEIVFGASEYEWQSIALGYAITRKAMNFNLYSGAFQNYNFGYTETVG